MSSILHFNRKAVAVEKAFMLSALLHLRFTIYDLG